MTMNNLQLDADYTQVEYQGEEFIPVSTTITGGTGAPVVTINGVVTGPNVTFSGGSSGFSYAPVGTTTLNIVSPLTTKGDVYGHTGAAGTRLAVGANGTVLTADSTQTTGLRWATSAAGSVTSIAAGTGVTLTPDPITTTGTVAIGQSVATAANPTFAGVISSTGGRFALKVTSPAQITSDQNNYNPGTGGWFRLSSDAARNITGILAGADGDVIWIANVGSNNIVLQNENVGSSAANQILTGTGADVTLAANDTAILIYDITSTRWRQFV